MWKIKKNINKLIWLINQTNWIKFFKKINDNFSYLIIYNIPEKERLELLARFIHVRGTWCTEQSSWLHSDSDSVPFSSLSLSEIWSVRERERRRALAGRQKWICSGIEWGPSTWTHRRSIDGPVKKGPG